MASGAVVAAKDPHERKEKFAWKAWEKALFMPRLSLGKE